MDEEIIGEDGTAGKAHLHKGVAIANHKTSPPGNLAGRNRAQGAPVLAGGAGNHEDDKETAKQRLQRLIRDFAHDTVGPGLEVEAHSKALIGTASASSDGVIAALLRMDRRLSRLELWPLSTQGGSPPGSQPMYSVVLQQVAAINKGGSPPEAGTDGEQDAAAAIAGRNDTCLCVVQRQGPEMRLSFDSTVSRDRAYTCLRIFQMSVDQSMDAGSRENESDTGYESSSVAVSP